MTFVAGTYKTSIILQGYTAPIFSATKISNRTYAAGISLVVTAVQENVPTVMVFGRLMNGDWVILLKNSKPQVTLISAGTTPPPPPPDPIVEAVHVIKINQTGLISVDGLGYE